LEASALAVAPEAAACNSEHRVNTSVDNSDLRSAIRGGDNNNEKKKKADDADDVYLNAFLNA
jgi:hypothetical protein